MVEIGAGVDLEVDEGVSDEMITTRETYRVRSQPTGAK